MVFEALKRWFFRDRRNSIYLNKHESQPSSLSVDSRATKGQSRRGGSRIFRWSRGSRYVRKSLPNLFFGHKSQPDEPDESKATSGPWQSPSASDGPSKDEEAELEKVRKRWTEDKIVKGRPRAIKQRPSRSFPGRLKEKVRSPLHGSTNLFSGIGRRSMRETQSQPEMMELHTDDYWPMVGISHAPKRPTKETNIDEALGIFTRELMESQEFRNRFSNNAGLTRPSSWSALPELDLSQASGSSVGASAALNHASLRNKAPLSQKAAGRDQRLTMEASYRRSENSNLFQLNGPVDLQESQDDSHNGPIDNGYDVGFAKIDSSGMAAGSTITAPIRAYDNCSIHDNRRPEKQRSYTNRYLCNGVSATMGYETQYVDGLHKQERGPKATQRRPLSFPASLQKDPATRTDWIHAYNHMPTTLVATKAEYIRCPPQLQWNTSPSACAHRQTVERDFMIAIDFGAGYFGYTFASKKRNDIVWIPVRSQDKLCEDVCERFPSVLLLSATGSYRSCGFVAQEFYSNLPSDQAGDYLYFANFKSLLGDENLTEKATATAISGATVPLIDVLSEFYGCIRDLALGQAYAITDMAINSRSIQWIITASGQWRPAARQMVRQAACKAGLINMPDSKLLILALEHEAAALCCRKLYQKSTLSAHVLKPQHIAYDYCGAGSAASSVSLKPGDAFAILDCGAGATSVSLYQIQSNGQSLKELAKVQCSQCGVYSVDESFLTLLGRMFSTQFMEDFRGNYPAAFVDLMMSFEAAKRSQQSRHVAIALPQIFRDYYVRSYDERVERAIHRFGNKEISSNSQGMLLISETVFQSLFDILKHELRRLIDHILLAIDRHRDIRYLFLIGGGLLSKTVKNCIQNLICRKFQVVVAEDCTLAVRNGALLYGMNSSSIGSRISSLTYGVGVLHRFNPMRHPESKRITKNGADWCADVFDTFIKASQQIEPGITVTRQYCPAVPSQKEIVIQIYCSAIEDPQYVTDEGVSKCGIIRFVLPPVAEPHFKMTRREIDATMFFEDVDLSVSARDKLTGKTVLSNVNFLQSHQFDNK